MIDFSETEDALDVTTLADEVELACANFTSAKMKVETLRRIILTHLDEKPPRDVVAKIEASVSAEIFRRMTARIAADSQNKIVAQKNRSGQPLIRGFVSKGNRYGYQDLAAGAIVQERQDEIAS